MWKKFPCHKIVIYRFGISHYSNVKWAPRHLKSLAFRLFVQQFAQAYFKENIKAPRHWLLWGEPPVDSLAKGQQRVKCFHSMPSPWMQATKHKPVGKRWNVISFSSYSIHSQAYVLIFSEPNENIRHLNIIYQWYGLLLARPNMKYQIITEMIMHLIVCVTFQWIISFMSTKTSAQCSCNRIHCSLNICILSLQLSGTLDRISFNWYTWVWEWLSYFIPYFYWAYGYLSLLGLKLIRLSKTNGSWLVFPKHNLRCIASSRFLISRKNTLSLQRRSDVSNCHW